MCGVEEVSVRVCGVGGECEGVWSGEGVCGVEEVSVRVCGVEEVIVRVCGVEGVKSREVERFRQEI